MTVVNAFHLRDSSNAHITSFSFFNSMKMIWSGLIPNAFNAGGKMRRCAPIQSATPPLLNKGESNPATNAPADVTSSRLIQENSCKAEKGNVAFGKKRAM